MPISYDKLWKLLIDKKMNRTELKGTSGISFNVLAKMGKNEFVSMESIIKICSTLSCNVGDIVDFLPESEELQK
ncbi:MAG: helix-turn-helix transcriptional regulator [Anaerovoracaceae bacterium]